MKHCMKSFFGNKVVVGVTLKITYLDVLEFHFVDSTSTGGRKKLYTSLLT